MLSGRVCVVVLVDRMDDVPKLTFIISRVKMRFSADETCQNVHKPAIYLTLKNVPLKNHNV